MRCNGCDIEFEKKAKANSATRFCSRKCALKVWRETNREKLRLYSNDWLHANQERHTAHNRKWRQSKPKAATAHTLVYKAVVRGKLTPLPCERCNSQPTHAHHDDYSKPLEVRWLCVKHHEETHHGR